MSETEPDTATSEELATLRAEVRRLRAALGARPEPRARRLMEPDPEMPGIGALWRGERGIAWRLFVQATVSVNAVLGVVAVITITSS